MATSNELHRGLVEHLYVSSQDVRSRPPFLETSSEVKLPIAFYDTHATLTSDADGVLFSGGSEEIWAVDWDEPTEVKLVGELEGAINGTFSVGPEHNVVAVVDSVGRTSKIVNFSLDSTGRKASTVFDGSLLDIEMGDVDALGDGWLVRSSSVAPSPVEDGEFFWLSPAGERVVLDTDGIVVERSVWDPTSRLLVVGGFLGGERRDGVIAAAEVDPAQIAAGEAILDWQIAADFRPTLLAFVDGNLHAQRIDGDWFIMKATNGCSD